MITTTGLLSALCLAAALWLGRVFPGTRRLQPALLAAMLFAWLVLALAWWAADHFTGEGIDESVLFHLWIGLEGAGLGAYLPVIAGVLAAVLLCAAGAGLLWRLYTRRPAAAAPFGAWLAGPALGAVALALHPTMADIGQLVHMHVRALHAAPTPSAHFAAPSPEPFPARKNLVVLYLESVERTFLDPMLFPGLMPRLSALEPRALSFTGLRQVYGTGWTIAGMTASQCGLPLVTPGDANSMSGADQFLPGARCLGDVLQDMGYDLRYLGGADLDFAGKGTFYRTHGFAQVQGKDELQPLLPKPGYASPWGLHDDSLYGLARQTFDELSAGTEPFGLFMLTLDTHPPGEHPSASCGKTVYQRGRDTMLNAVHCADKLAADFIEGIIDGPHAANTVVVVLSDHLAMRSSASERLDEGGRRNLAMVFHPDLPPGTVDKPGSTLDLAPTLVGLLGGRAPRFGYGRDLLAEAPTLVGQMGDDTDDHLRADQPFLASLWNHPQLFEGIAVDTAARTLTLGDRTIRYPALLLLDERYRVADVHYPFYSHTGLNEYVADLDAGTRFVWVDHCRLLQPLTGGLLGGDTCMAAGSLGQARLPVDTLREPTQVPWNRLQERLAAPARDTDSFHARVQGLGQWRRYGADEVATYQGPAHWRGELIVRSSAYDNDPSEVRGDGHQTALRLSPGLTLLGLDSQGRTRKLGHADTCTGALTRHGAHEPALRGDLSDAVARHRRRYEAFLVVAHFPQAQSPCAPSDLAPLFERSGLAQWRALEARQPYIGLLTSDGQVHEFVGTPGTSLAVDMSQTKNSQVSRTNSGSRMPHDQAI